MGKAIPITLGGVNFTKKTDCAKYISSLLNGDIREIREGRDFNILVDLLKRHPEAKEKIGAGILYFSIAESPFPQGDNHFVVHRTDGSSIDFSYTVCLGWKSQKELSLTYYKTKENDEPLINIERNKRKPKAYETGEWFKWEYFPVLNYVRTKNYTTYIVSCCKRVFCVTQEFIPDGSEVGYTSHWKWFERKGGAGANGRGNSKNQCFINIARLFSPNFNPKIDE